MTRVACTVDILPCCTAHQVLGEFTAEDEAPSVLKDLSYDISILAKYRDAKNGDLLVRVPADIPDEYQRLSGAYYPETMRYGIAKSGERVPLEEIYIKGIGEWSLK